MPRNVTVGIDIGTHQIQVVVAEWARGSEKMRVLGTGVALSDGVRRGNIERVEDAARALKEAVKRAEMGVGFKIGAASFSFGGASLSSVLSRGQIVVSGETAEITRADIDRAIEVSHAVLLPIANKIILHRIPVIFRVDNGILTQTPAGLAGSRLEVDTLFVTGFHPHAENIVAAAAKAGVAVDNLTATPIAAAHAVLSKRQKEVGVMLLDIGAGSTSLAIYEEGRPISVETFPVGSASITHDLAIGFKIGIDDAEALKQSYDNYQGQEKKKVEEVIAARITGIFELVYKHLKKIGRDRLLPAGVVLTGGGANLAGIQDIARRELELPVEKGRFTGIETARGDLLDSSWTAAIGLCAMSINAQDGFSGVFPIRLLIRLPGVGPKLGRWFRAFLP